MLDQFEAADVLIPVARLERQWPGGPVRGTFTARYGPDNRMLESFTLTANSEETVPQMLNTALVDQRTPCVEHISTGCRRHAHA